jgi:O-antigen/teichoic acid export membrane protein
MALVTWASIVYGVVTGAAGIALIVATGSVVAFCGAAVLGQTAVLAFLTLRLPRSLRRGRVERGRVAALVRSVAPFAAGFVMLTLFYKVDVVLLERWRSRDEVGLYVAAYRFLDLTHALALAAIGAVYPALARRSARTSGAGTGTRAGELGVLAWAPVAAVLFVAREAVVVGLFGAAYAPAVVLLAFLAPAIPALAFNLYAAHLLGASDRMRWMAGVFTAGLAVKVALDGWLIPLWGATGAAAAMLLAEIAVALMFLAVLSHVLGAAPRARIAGVMLGVAALTAGAAALPAPAAPWGGAAIAAGLALVVLVAYRLAGVVSPTEWAMVKAAFDRSASSTVADPDANDGTAGPA